MGIPARAATLRALGRTPFEEMVCPKKSALVVPMVAFEGESLRSILSQPFEERAEIAYVLQRAFVKNDDVIEVCLDSIKSFDYFVKMILTKWPADWLASIGMRSHSNKREGVAKAVRGVVSLWTVIWWKDPVKSNSRKQL